MNSFFYQAQAGFQAVPYSPVSFGGFNPFFQAPQVSAPFCPPSMGTGMGIGTGGIAQANFFWQQLMQVQQNLFSGWQQFGGCPQSSGQQGCQPSFGGQNPNAGGCKPHFGGPQPQEINIHHHYHFHDAAPEPVAPTPKPTPAPKPEPQVPVTELPPLPAPPLTRTPPLPAPPRTQTSPLPAVDPSPVAVNYKAHAFSLPMRTAGVGGMMMTKGNYALQNPDVAARASSLG